MYIWLLLKTKDSESLEISLIVAIGKLCSRSKTTVIKVKFYFLQLTVMGETGENKKGERAYNLYISYSLRKQNKASNRTGVTNSD